MKSRLFMACTTLVFPLALFAQDTSSIVSASGSGMCATSLEAWINFATPETENREAPRHITVGSADEGYLRYLQDAGLARPYPWSLREFSQSELADFAVKTASHPWSGRSGYESDSRARSAELLPLNVVFRFNTSFPYGSNDGAVWAGRGLTSALDFGVSFRFGPLSGTLNPIVFRAENTAFRLQPTAIPFADPLFPTLIDRPQRFGSRPYSRFDPGESTLRLDMVGIGAGVSTANMGWGPMELYPYIIGANAAGFPHAFVGPSRPLPIWIGTVHGKLFWGSLSQSSYSPVTGTSYYSSELEPGTKRFMSGAVGVFQPRGLTGLELGVARFFHSVWPREGIPRSYFTKPFEALLKNSLGPSAGFAKGSDAGVGDNQLASAFARWLIPAAGFELYGEYGREDHNADLRDLLQEPDHSRTYGLGFRKVLSTTSSSLRALRFEMINYELPTLARHRSEGGIYIHSVLRQGHTNIGQPIGSDAGVGTGGGSTIAWDSFSKSGRTTFSWTRTVREQNGSYYLGLPPNPRSNDVAFAFAAERVRLVAKGELNASLAFVRELNRYFQADAWNVNSTAGMRFRF